MLKIHNVSLKRGNFEIKNINLVIKEGITNFLGPSGSGKSTLLDIIAGFLKPQEGKIELYNQDITLLEPFLRNISYCPQDFYLFPHLNVKENILISKKYGLEIYDNWENLIKELELENHLQKRINELSIGEKQRVALARSLIVKKKLLLLDEPFSSISESLKTKLWKLIKRIQKEREIILIISTHNIKEALYLSDYLVIIDEGKIIDQGEPLKLFFHPSSLKAANYWGIKNLFTSKLEDKFSNFLLFSLNNLKIKILNRIKEPQIGKSYIIGFREESVKIIDFKTYQDNLTNILKIKILQTTFLGDYYLIEGKVEGLDHIVNFKSSYIPERENVYVLVEPDKWFILES